MEVIYATTLQRPSYEELVDHVVYIFDRFPNIKKCLIDQSEPGLIKQLKRMFDDNYINYDKMKNVEKFPFYEIPIFCPICFQKRKEMIRHSVKVLGKHYLRIDKSFHEFISALRTAKATSNNMDFSKQDSSYPDLTDCYIMQSILVEDVNE